MTRRAFALVAVLLVFLGGASRAQAGALRAGSFRLLTYNVAGLPEGISKSRPSLNMGLISRLVNDYDIVLAQEDFAFQALLRSSLTLPHRSPDYAPIGAFDLGDGLSRFSRTEFVEYRREVWATCNGVVGDGCDCLANKGFSVARHALSGGAHIDVYNLHMDSGRSAADRVTRKAQLEQLRRAISRYSSRRAVIVAGDTNLTRVELPELARFEKSLGLSDSCRSVGCSQPWRIDRVLYRSGAAVNLVPRRWRIDARFVDGDARPLSDHLAVAVDFDWATPEPHLVSAR
jgi:hypothetical protein